MNRLTPELVGVREETKDGRYCLVLEFQTKKDMTMEMWTDRQSKIQTFFGPGVTAELESPVERRVDVYLTSDGRQAVFIYSPFFLLLFGGGSISHAILSLQVMTNSCKWLRNLEELG